MLNRTDQKEKKRTYLIKRIKKKKIRNTKKNLHLK